MLLILERNYEQAQFDENTMFFSKIFGKEPSWSFSVKFGANLEKKCDCKLTTLCISQSNEFFGEFLKFYSQSSSAFLNKSEIHMSYLKYIYSFFNWFFFKLGIYLNKFSQNSVRIFPKKQLIDNILQNEIVWKLSKRSLVLLCSWNNLQIATLKRIAAPKHNYVEENWEIEAALTK